MIQMMIHFIGALNARLCSYRALHGAAVWTLAEVVGYLTGDDRFELVISERNSESEVLIQNKPGDLIKLFLYITH